MHLGDDGQSLQPPQAPPTDASPSGANGQRPHPRRKRDQLARIKHAVVADEYLNPLKLSIALDRLLKRLGD